MTNSIDTALPMPGLQPLDCYIRKGFKILCWEPPSFLGDDEDESGDQSDNESAEELDSGSQTDDKLLGNIRELNFITLALRLHYNKHKTVCILCIGTEPDCPSIGDSEVNDTIFENSEHSSCELVEEVRKCLQPST